MVYSNNLSSLEAFNSELKKGCKFLIAKASRKSKIFQFLDLLITVIFWCTVWGWKLRALTSMDVQDEFERHREQVLFLNEKNEALEL